MTGALPKRLRDLDSETLLCRLDSKQREALILVGRLDLRQRERLDQDHFEAGFAVVQLWTCLRWLSASSMWIVFTVAGLLFAVDQIMTR
ncbi:MAG: hypothetical protein E5Y52_11390 [Mesorhizobium sp.]|nr:MAG: hypothetical protein E5Y52_11390 [Mesorhizobium sp.]